MKQEDIRLFPQEKPVVLAVDDDRILRTMLVNKLDNLGYTILEALNGQQALDILSDKKNYINAILLDREMPVMNGIELVKHIKNDKALRRIPVIMQTGADQPQQIQECINAGVFYYLTKPIDNKILKSILSTAIHQSKRQQLLPHDLQSYQTSFYLIDACKFHIKTLAEAQQLATFLAYCFNDADRVVGGLIELLINAIEHGNLGITYEEKTTLISSGQWQEEVERRQGLKENKIKNVTVTFHKQPEGNYITIADQGNGFDWKRYLIIDPARLTDNHGRGIVQAKAISFDKLTYNTVGNEVTAFVSNKEESI